MESFNRAAEEIQKVSRQAARTATASAEAAADAMRSAARTDFGRTAHRVSSTLESALSREPVNSTMRTALLSLAGLAALSSIGLYLAGRKHESILVGQWTPMFLGVALWSQVVKR